MNENVLPVSQIPSPRQRYTAVLTLWIWGLIPIKRIVVRVGYASEAFTIL